MQLQLDFTEELVVLNLTLGWSAFVNVEFLYYLHCAGESREFVDSQVNLAVLAPAQQFDFVEV